jgi:hypothetical protein
MSKEPIRLEEVEGLQGGRVDASDIVGWDCKCTGWRRLEVVVAIENFCYHNFSASSLSNLTRRRARSMGVVPGEEESSFRHERRKYGVVGEVVVWVAYEHQLHAVTLAVAAAAEREHIAAMSQFLDRLDSAAVQADTCLSLISSLVGMD